MNTALSRVVGASPSSEDEDRLIDRSRRGDIEAFSGLVLLYQVRVRAYVGGYLFDPDVTDDVAQDVFISAFRHIDTYRAEAPFGIWLLRIAHNRVVSHLRTETRRHSREMDLMDLFLPWLLRDLDTAKDADLSRQERDMGALHRCLANLAPLSAQIVREHYFQARSLVQIARDLDKKEGTVRMTLLRTRQALRECLQKSWQEAI